MVTHQLQVRCRPVKVRHSETDVLPLSHPTNHTYILTYLHKMKNMIAYLDDTRPTCLVIYAKNKARDRQRSVEQNGEKLEVKLVGTVFGHSTNCISGAFRYTLQRHYITLPLQIYNTIISYVLYACM